MDKTTQDFMDKIKVMTGKNYDEIDLLYKKSNLTKHSEIRSYFMQELQLSYGFANTLVHIITKSDGASMAEGKDISTILDEIYSGSKSHFRPIHDLIMKRISVFGDFEIVPKKGYLSLKRKRQFAIIGPKTNTRMEIGINLKDYQGTSRLVEQPKGSMCKFIVKIESVEDVDTELVTWLQEAYNQSNH